MSKAIVVAAAAVALPAPAAAAQQPPPPRPQQWAVRSPDGRLAAVVAQARPGAPLRLTVRRDGRRLLAGALGLDTSAGRLVHGLRLRGRSAATVDERYATPVGKRLRHRLRARRLTLRLRRGATTVALQLLAADDGIAYRYRLAGRGPVRVVGERSSFAPARGTRTWLQRWTANYERPYDEAPLGAVAPGRYAFPALLGLGRGTWALLSESGVDGRFAAARLAVSAARPGRLRVEPVGAVRGRRPLATPWRVAVVGELATIVGSDLVESLGGRSQIADERWIEPGRVAWSWWSDPGSSRSYERQLDYVALAAAMGWEYVLVDEGWDEAWMPRLVAEARRRGVRVLLWARWSDLESDAQRDELLGRWAAWGVAGVKLDFPQSDGQPRMAWYERTARAAADARLLVDFHGCTLPRGIQRRWPNVMTMEAVMGAEHELGGAAALSARHNATLPFTRNAVGSMDYTPVTFSAAGRTTTAGQQLALAVVFESGLQHFADSPQAYALRPEAEELLRAVPVAWDETRLLGGYPGRAATVARRRGGEWWVGAIGAGAARAERLPLRFLDPGRSYAATVVADAPGDGLRLERRTVTAADALALELAADGGATVRLVPR